MLTSGWHNPFPISSSIDVASFFAKDKQAFWRKVCSFLKNKRVCNFFTFLAQEKSSGTGHLPFEEWIGKPLCKLLHCEPEIRKKRKRAVITLIKIW